MLIYCIKSRTSDLYIKYFFLVLFCFFAVHRDTWCLPTVCEQQMLGTDDQAKSYCAFH